MRIKLDENLPVRLTEALTRIGHDVDTVIQEGLLGHDDESVWSAAQNAGRFLITQDMDFSDLRRFVFGQHAGVMLVRLREPGRQALLARITTVFEVEDTSAWGGAFVVVTDSKTRVRLPERNSQEIAKS